MSKFKGLEKQEYKFIVCETREFHMVNSYMGVALRPP